MELLLQITIELPARFRDRLPVLVGGGNRVPAPSAGAGCGAGAGCYELAVHVVETGCWCWVSGADGCARGGDRLLVVVLGAGRRRRWRQVVGVGAGCWCWWYSLHICGDLFCPDSKAMELLLQITMSCLRALSRQVAGAGGRWKQGAGAGCRCRALVRAVVLVLGAVSWLRAWWRHGAGAGRWQCAW